VVSDVVLDVGGGTGINAIMMAQRCKKVTLVDISTRIKWGIEKPDHK
jgi:ubiquinone/menaquinone biosynthesis C-methylase UbiE